MDLTAWDSKVLPVPYFIQPTAITCQSTCLKMMSVYLERNVLLMSTGAEALDIQAIWKEVNQGAGRPSPFRNAHTNFKWWLARRFPQLSFNYVEGCDEGQASSLIVNSIDRGMPVLASVSHENVAGHIVLAIGYEGHVPGLSSVAFNVIVHDPYGRFDPVLRSTLYGKKRMSGGMSLLSGSETGPGQACRVPITAVGRRRKGDNRAGHFYLLMPTRQI